MKRFGGDVKARSRERQQPMFYVCVDKTPYDKERKRKWSVEGVCSETVQQALFEIADKNPQSDVEMVQLLQQIAEQINET